MLQERCQLYQMKDGEALREYIFQPFAVLASKRYFPNEADYDMAYDDLLRPNEDVRTVRERLSALQRNRGCFRQINTSDVIVLRRETGTICCFVDGDGFVMLDGFFGLPTSGNPLTLETEHYQIPGKKGLWRVVDSITYENILFFLLEHEEHGREIPCVILDSKGEVVSDTITKDFDETAEEQMRLFLHPEMPKQSVEHERPPKELWQKFYENGEYVRHASHEVGSEENYNHIDGVNNNRKPQRPVWVDPKKRPSVRKRLQEKLNQVHGGKEKQRTREKAQRRLRMSFLNHKNNQEHTLPDVFTAAKHSVTARQVAEMYGIEVNAHGMACCPFHDDTHPSMKLDERYYCFGCHASGDAIDFVSNLFQIGKREAAVKIAEDFHISYDPRGRPGRGQLVTPEQKKELEMRQLQKDFREWRGKVLSNLNGDYRILTERAEQNAPTDRNAPFPQGFVQAYNDRTLVEFYIGVLETAPRETQINLYLRDRAAIAALDDRVNGRGQPRTSVREKLEEKKSLLKAQRDGVVNQKQRAAI